MVFSLIGCQLVMLLRLDIRYSHLVTWMALTYTTGALGSDVFAVAAGSTRGWPSVILCMDLMLVVGADRRVQAVIMGMALFVIAAVAAETTAQYGLFEVSMWNAREELFLEQCDCGSPPCERDMTVALGHWVGPSIVLLADFHLTRGFSLRLRNQMNVNDTTVRVAERVAHLSAEYDIAEARRVVDEEGEALSEPLRDAYDKLLTNLERYRAFLPAGLLAEDKAAGAERTSEAEAQGARLLPQLDSQLSRNALHTIYCEASGRHRVRADAVMTERFEACLGAGDGAGLRHLLQTGWEATPALMERYHELYPDGGCSRLSQRSAPEINMGKSVIGWAAFMGEDTGEDAPADPAEVEPLKLSTHRDRLAVSIVTTTSCSSGSSSEEIAVLRRAQRQPVRSGRFGDGADSPAGTVTVTELWPHGYRPPPAVDAVQNISKWHTVKGETYWPSVAVRQMVADFNFFYPDASKSRQNPIALYLYTLEITEAVVWAAWQGERWRLYPNQGNVEAQYAGTTLQLGAEDMRAIGMQAPGSRTVELIFDHEWGMRVYGAGRVPLLLRYENRRRGNPEVSPINDTAVWAPSPDAMMSPGSFFSYCRPDHPPPPPGVLEYVTSRDFRTVHSFRNWGGNPVTPPRFAKLIEQCMAQKNQQRAKERLCQFAEELFSYPPGELGGFGVDAGELAVALPILYRQKCPAESPTPAQIAHACELGVLRWRSSHLLVALTGEPRVAVPLQREGRPGAERLYRLSRATNSGQPYHLMNSAMRSQQSRAFDAILETSDRARYVARQPRDPPPVPAPELFVDAAVQAVRALQAEYQVQWDGQGWAISVGARRVAVEVDVNISENAWGLPQFRAVIWHIDACLQGLPEDQSNDGARKGYRGLSNVTLDRSVYSRGRIVVFTAFTSTSDDQGVASGFATSSGAAVVFTMFTSSGRCISAWSRFGREKEVLLRPNTLHLVTEALSAEHAAIMDKEALQVFDLREVSMAEAVRHLAKEGALAVSRDYPSVLRQAELTAAAAERGDWVAALRELLTAPKDEPRSAGEGRFVRSIMPRSTVGVIALVLTSPAGSELGAGIESGLWNDYFERAEQCAAKFDAHVLATPLGQIMVQVGGLEDGPEATALAAVSLAEELLGAVISESPKQSPRSSHSASGRNKLETSLQELDISTMLGVEIFSPAAPVRRRSRRVTAVVASSSGGRDRPPLQVHCGVTVGTVHSGFGGSAQHRVEIADGPAVRRAFRMAMYSRRHGLSEICSDTSCTLPAARADYTTWTVDLVSFDSERDMREPLSCIVPKEGRAGSTPNVRSEDARRIEDAWAAIAAATAGIGAGAALQHLQDCVAALPRAFSSHRAARALQDAAAKPATYCCDLDGVA